ncbi:putative lysophosphatidic acid acyltransferase [Tieghemostelium lacteum]|uniref:Putative lysophosphatidic acid acyltransferase n=1 Tax=Tieghemostelium lacteum TaxID=361077 RepID=A0A152A0V8_TIELA|nr:putative lysophosphatidic acid acyltransferase [Tieghemostelium lacteum]|eukprot:KYQ99849.1 putative lysophosphatidic acid acyltransferase [Tieghemostelium lacteum]
MSSTTNISNSATTTNALKKSISASSSSSSVEISSQDSWSLLLPTNSTEIDEVQKLIEEKLIKQLKKQINPSKKFNLGDVSPLLNDGIEVLIDDEFSKCFTSPEYHAWNWNIYLYPAWLLGAFIRYCILFPLRLTCLIIGSIMFGIGFIMASKLVKDEKKKKYYQRKMIGFLCIVFIMSWSGVIRYHGVRPLRKKNQIFVANHTTVMDIVVLQNQFNYASVGQKHKGFLGFVQDNILNCVGCLWFDRAESKDRHLVAKQISEHIGNEANDPILIFPEGVCVNNQYSVMFKKGAFDLPNVIIYPIAIKYNTLFVDAFWNSKKQSIYRHIFNLMTSWALVCDVWYMEPQTMRPGETATQFSNRVKAMISKKAGIINVHWDGYLKYFKPSSRFSEHKQKIFASRFKNRFTGENDQDDKKEVNSPSTPTSPNTSSIDNQNEIKDLEDLNGESTSTTTTTSTEDNTTTLKQRKPIETN